MLPLTKTVTIINGKKLWEFKVNPNYYGLSVNLDAKIIYMDGCPQFVTVVRNKDWQGKTAFTKKEFSTSFKSACKFLEDNAIKPMFKY